MNLILSVFQSKRLAVTVLSNDGSFWAEGNGRRIADIYLQEYLNEQEEEEEEELSYNKMLKSIIISLDSLRQKKYCEEYWCETEGIQRKISFVNGGLRYITKKDRYTDLLPISDNKFVLKGTSSDITISFNKNENGNFDMLFESKDEKLLFTPISKKDLTEFEGQYYSKELDTYYRIEVKEDFLVAHHQRIEDILLHPIVEDKFS